MDYCVISVVAPPTNSTPTTEQTIATPTVGPTDSGKHNYVPYVFHPSIELLLAVSTHMCVHVSNTTYVCVCVCLCMSTYMCI